MAIQSPKFTIDNFTGMGDNGHYFLKGFAPAKINGQSILSMEHRTELFRSSTNFSDLSNVTSATITDDEDSDQFIFFGSGEMHEFSDFPSNDVGLIHSISTTGTGTDQILSGKGDIITSLLGNLLYTSSNHLGIGYKGVATGGTSTTLVDSSVDFTALEEVTAGSACTLKVVNVTQKEIFTVIGVATNTLTFSAGTTTPASGDYYYFFVDGKYKFGTFSGINNQFDGQTSSTKWGRKILLWEDTYFIINGNYISSLNLAEDTFNATLQKLPSRSTAVTMEANGSQILIGTEVDNRGELVLWDGKLEGFLNRIKLPQPVQCMTYYKGGWLYVMGPHIYFTNGYSVEKLIRLPDLRDDRDITDIQLNGIKEIYGNIYVAISSNGTSRLKNGLLVFDPDNGFTYVPATGDDGEIMSGNVGGIFSFQTSTNSTFIYAEDQAYSETLKVINNVYTSTDIKATAIFFQKLPNKITLSDIELNIGAHHLSSSKGNTTVTVNVGDASNFFWGNGFTSNGSTTTSIINGNGAQHSANVGDQLWMLEGLTGGERTIITEVVNQGTSTETLTVSPALSAVPYDGTSANFNIIRLKKTTSVTFSNRDIPTQLSFPLNGFYSDNVFIEVKVDGSPIDIHSIKVV